MTPTLSWIFWNLKSIQIKEGSLAYLTQSTVIPDPGGPYFGSTVNPIPTGEGRLFPPKYYYWHPQCFSPSGITEVRTYLRIEPVQKLSLTPVL